MADDDHYFRWDEARGRFVCVRKRVDVPPTESERCQAEATHTGSRCERFWKVRNVYGLLVCVQHVMRRR